MELIEEMARAMTPLLCGGQEDALGHPLPDKTFESIPQDWQERFKEYAQAALNALIEHAGGDGVTDADERAAWETGIRLAKDDWLKLFQAFARHRALAFAAGKAARDREIVEWLRDLAHESQRKAAEPIADAIERGEV